MVKSPEEKAAEKAAKEAAKAIEAEQKAAEKAAKGSKVDPELQAAWDAFLEKARAQREEDGTLHIFEEQMARGEFATIPDSFKFAQSIRVAPK